MRVAKSSGVIGHNVWDLVGTDFLSLDFAELKFGFFGLQGLEDELALGVVEDSEVLAGLLDGDDVHYSSWEGGVSSNFPIDFYAAFLIFHNHRDFSIIEGIFKTIPQNHCQGNRLSQFVGTGSGSGSPDSSSFGKHPAGGSGNFVNMFFGASSHIAEELSK